jgi:hypothetical protein
MVNTKEVAGVEVNVPNIFDRICIGKPTTNTLDGLLRTLKRRRKTEKDIKWVGCSDFKIEWSEFIKLLDKKRGSKEHLFRDLRVVGEDWWLEPNVDGISGRGPWLFYRVPREPKHTESVDRLLYTKSGDRITDILESKLGVVNNYFLGEKIQEEDTSQ